MARDLSAYLEQTIKRELPNLRDLTEERASIPRAPGKWSPKEELGHLIDSAANNHIRFVQATIAEFRGSGYSQDDWARLHGYGEMPWEAIVNLWFPLNTHLARLVDRIPDDRLEALCFIGSNPALPLRFVIDDYVFHMQHHIDQLLGREVVTQYPRANKGSL